MVFALMVLTSLAFLGPECDEVFVELCSFIDQPIVLEASDRVAGTETAANEFTFDLSSLSLVADRTFNDIEVSYITPNASDEVVELYNFGAGQWDQVGFPLLGYVSASIPTTHYHTVRDLLGNAQRYVNTNGILMLRGAYGLEVRVLRVRATYAAARPIGGDNINSFDGLTYDGTHFWASSNLADRLYLIDGTGAVVSEFDSPGGHPFDLAFGGQNVWLADGSDRVLRMSPDKTLTGEFTVPTDYPGGLAWGDDSLWLSEYAGPDPRTFRIDPSASCAAGVAVVTDVFQTPGGESWQLAWNGENLLIVSDALYVVNVDGTVVRSYPIPVNRPQGLAWDGQSVVMFSQGPDGVGNSGQKLNWFCLR